MLRLRSLLVVGTLPAIAYIALLTYLLHRVRPVPITVLSFGASTEPVPTGESARVLEATAKPQPQHRVRERDRRHIIHRLLRTLQPS